MKCYVLKTKLDCTLFWQILPGNVDLIDFKYMCLSLIYTTFLNTSRFELFSCTKNISIELEVITKSRNMCNQWGKEKV